MTVDALVETQTAAEWNVYTVERSAHLDIISPNFKEAALNSRKPQPKDIFTLAVHSSLGMMKVLWSAIG